MVTDLSKDPLVTAEWLNDAGDGVKILDATYFMPADAKRAKDEFHRQRIPRARLFEIDEIAEKGSNLPHMMPSWEALSKAAGILGIDRNDTIVVYDRSSNHFSAPRVWYTFKAFGHSNVYVLNGGLSAWTSAGFSTESGQSPHTSATYDLDEMSATGVVACSELISALSSGRSAFQIVDARSKGRFEGHAPEPRPHLRSGHMPGAKNVPFDLLTGSDGKFLSAADISALFTSASIELSKPVVTTCGSGLTAAVLALALNRIGVQNLALYDGSWVEWAGRADTPIVVGS